MLVVAAKFIKSSQFCTLFFSAKKNLLKYLQKENIHKPNCDVHESAAESGYFFLCVNVVPPFI